MTKKFFWKVYSSITNPSLQEEVWHFVARQVPTDAFRRLTFNEKLRIIEARPEKFERYLGPKLTEGVGQIVRHKQFRTYEDLQQRGVLKQLGIDPLIGISYVEGTIITEAFRPFFSYFFAGSMRIIVGGITGFDALFQFFPSPLTNLYLTPYTGRYVPRHEWGTFLHGKQYVIPRGRPTDRQRAWDGLLIAMNAGTPSSLAKYLLQMAGILFAKMMWDRLRNGEDTGTPPPTLPVLDNGQASTTQTPQQSVELVNGPEYTGVSSQGSRSLLSSAIRGTLGLRLGYAGLGQPWTFGHEWRFREMVHRAAKVRCKVCHSEFICSETHAAHHIFYIGEEDPFFPCPVCNEWADEDVLLVLSPCSVHLIYLDAFRAFLFGIR